LFYDCGALSDEYAGAFADIVGAVTGMPYLSSFQHIYDVVIVAPEVLVFILKPAIEKREQGFTAGKSPAAFGVGRDMCIKIVQRLRSVVKSKNNFRMENTIKGVISIF